jgi:hypothetical protein
MTSPDGRLAHVMFGIAKRCKLAIMGATADGTVRRRDAQLGLGFTPPGDDL